jgi:hypothetical protein
MELKTNVGSDPPGPVGPRARGHSGGHSNARQVKTAQIQGFERVVLPGVVPQFS